MKYITLVILAISLLACSATKKNSSNKKEQQLKPTEYKFGMSLHTKLFLADYNKEKSEFINKEYLPSDNLINNYSLKKIDNEYTVSGFIKTNSDFQKEDLVPLNIKNGSDVNKIITVIIPLSSVDDFLKLDGINYFEIGEKVELKKTN